MGRFNIHSLLEDNTWSDRYTVTENTQYSNSSTERTLLNLDFTVEK